MKKSLYKLVSVTMTLLLLLSTISWKLERHFCMGRLIKVTFFTAVDTYTVDISASMNGDRFGETTSVCADEVLFTEGQDVLKIFFKDWDMEQQHFLIALANSYFNVPLDLKEQSGPHEHYPPPILVKDIQLLDELYLI